MENRADILGQKGLSNKREREVGRQRTTMTSAVNLHQHKKAETRKKIAEVRLEQ